MRIFAICLTCNEADVVGACLQAARAWCDRILVYDGGSTDGTWEIVQRLADDVIVPWRSEKQVFREGLRAEVFNAFRAEARAGDWWCQLNADEFYVEEPRSFLSRVPKSEHIVWAVNLQYYLTPEMLAEAELSGVFERDRPRFRHYDAPTAERRFFRHRARLRWDPAHAWPRHLGINHPRLLHFQHYPLRSPAQIQQRLEVRRRHRAAGFEGWDHASALDWKEKLVPVARLVDDRGDGNWVVADTVKRTHHESSWRVALKRILHGTGIYP
jgi:glycosyltransferase involved in cell wall biosynthesis